MKKFLAVTTLSLAIHLSFAEIEPMGEIFHSGAETEKAAQAMRQEVMMTAFSAIRETGGKEVSEEAIANILFETMDKHADSVKLALQKDCAAENDAQKCACFYEQIDLKEMFHEMKKASLEQDNDKAEQSMKAYQESVTKKKVQCEL